MPPPPPASPPPSALAESPGALRRHWYGNILVPLAALVDGISLLRSGSTAYRATGSEAWLPHIIALRAGACEIIGRFEEALGLLDNSLQIAERTGERWFAAELNRNKGEPLL